MLHPHLFSGRAFAGMRIGLLGGSFNPAHDGHRAMSLYALKRLGLDQVWWLVSPQNPLKLAEGMAPLAARLQGARKASRHSRIVVTDIEAQLDTQYTVDTLRALKRRFPGVQFVWLMGADNLMQMPRWHAWPEIFRLVPVAVFRRPAYAMGRNAGKAAQRFVHARLPAQRAGCLMHAALPAWVMLDNRLNASSATKIRDQQ